MMCDMHSQSGSEADRKFVTAMKGIRNKIILGFMALGILLFFSGLMSYFELGRLTHSSQNMLEGSLKNLEHSKTMLDAVQDENTALLQIMVGGRTEYDSLLGRGRAQFAEAVTQARISSRAMAALDTVIAANIRYSSLIDSRLASGAAPDDVEWFMDIYRTSYYELTAAIKTFMVSSQHMMDVKAQQLEGNAYRAIMPGVIALAIAILIILVFFFMIDVYFIRPVLKITQGLHNFLTARVPFNVTMEGRDEVRTLKEYIEELISQLKSKKTE